MELLTRELIRELLSVSSAPCLSIYMTTHGSHPENLQDPIRFKNLVKQLEESLLQQYSALEVKKFVEPFEALGNNTQSWNHTLDGLAVFSTPGLFKVIGLKVPVEELVIVADSFYTKPLRQYLQTGDRYYVLCLSLSDIRLFEGNRRSLTEVKLLPDIPKTITEALGTELTQKHSIVASYGSSEMHHGHGGKKDEVGKDAEKFFRLIAIAIYENYSKPTGFPLILAALPEHHNLFHKVSKNPFLFPNDISVNPESISVDKLTKMAWEVIEPYYSKNLKSLTDKFEVATANNLGSNNINEIAEAAEAGRVEILLLEADRVIAKRLRNKNTGAFKQTDSTQPILDDQLDDIGELVTGTGGQVMMIPAEMMSTKTGVAAVFRY